MEKIAIFPGSFDPITLGHYDIIKRAVHLFDHIIVSIGYNSQKNYMFSLEKRIQFLQSSLQEFDNVSVESYEGLTIEYCKKKGAQFILRGLRNPADFEFEKAIAHTNRLMTENKIETIFFLTSSDKSFISSSIVRDVMRNGGDYSKLVPKNVLYKKS